jgi:ferredoxin--NADP+ reductase
MVKGEMALGVVAGASALYCGVPQAFVQAVAGSGAPAGPHLRSGGAAPIPATSATYTGLPAAGAIGGLAVVAAVGVASRRRELGVACQAAKVKKKGVRMVEGKEIPWNIFSPKAPYKGKVVPNHVQQHTITKKNSDSPGDANWETTHVTFDHGGKVPYVEGQSIGVVAPGPDKKGETPAKIRLYSIASSAVGDCEDSKTVSLCVKRVVEVEEEKWPLKHSNRDVGEDKPDKAGTCFPEAKVYRGVCSNHICDMNVGDDVLITGPTGSEMLLPEDLGPDCNIIMLATGTGIAPMRSYYRYMFNDKVAEGKFQGNAWLFLGVPYSASILYDDENKEMKEKFPDRFRYDYAVSREQKNAAGEKMYIQTKMAEYRDELWELIKKPKTHIYMCGLKGMESGMEQCFSEVAEKEGLVWKDYAKQMKKDKRYHVEVY